jgi:hypothetical protein
MFSSCIGFLCGWLSTIRERSASHKCGFVVEGREREAAIVDGIWHDDVMIGIVDREYTEIRSSKAQPHPQY